jgi:membrane dipeptidase
MQASQETAAAGQAEYAMMARRGFLRQATMLGLGATGMCLGLPALAQPAGDTRSRRPLIIDALGSIVNPNRPQAERNDPNNIGVDARSLADARAAGLSAFNMTIGYWAGKDDPYEQSVREVAAWDAFIRRHGNALVKVQQAADIRRAHEQGRTGVILGFQNAAMMGNDARRVETFASLGVKVIQLTYNGANQLGDGAMAPANRGLTPFGHEVVQALNRHRVMVDLSHSGEQICLDAAAASSDPIAITHTGCRALVDLPRNKSDREMRLVAEKGGFVGMYFMPFLAMGRQPMAADLVAHIEHAIKVCGEDHVGIGSDGYASAIDDVPGYMRELEKVVQERRAAGISAPGERGDIVTFLPDLQGPDKFHKLADLLAKRGHSASRIDKILGLNFLRFAGDIWG